MTDRIMEPDLHQIDADAFQFNLSTIFNRNWYKNTLHPFTGNWIQAKAPSEIDFRLGIIFTSRKRSFGFQNQFGSGSGAGIGPAEDDSPTRL